MKTRGKPIPAPDWWVRLAREALIAEQSRGVSREVLGEQLAEMIDRDVDYNHSVLTKFLNDDTGKTTQEFADAICARFPSVPRLFYVPRSAEEAKAMQAIADAFDRTDPLRIERKRQLDQRLARFERAVEDHSLRLDSSDEDRRQDDRRDRGIHRRRPASS